MTRRDWQTNTEQDAGKADRLEAWADFQDERDEPGLTTDRGHDCSLAPFPDDCLSCVVWERYWIKEREERPPVELPEVLPRWMQRGAS